MSIASGDIDGDGKDEIVAFYMNEMFILDGGSSLYKIKQAVSIAEDESDSFFRAKCADFNGDGKDEIILVEGAHEDKKVAECTIYDWDGAELLSPMTSFSNYRFSIEASGTNNGIRTPDFATGDFNGDGTPDIAFAGQSSDKDTIHLLVVCKVAVNDDSKPEFTCLADNGSNVVGNTKNWFSSVACGDLDMNTDSNGHFRNEIVDYDDVYKVSEDSKGAASVEKKYSDKLNTPYPDMLAVGDVNNDGVAEIVTEYQNIDELHIYHLDSDSSFSCKKLDTSDTEKDGSICLPDIEGKSEVLEYVAHTLQYSTPQVLAVITAPPCYSSDSAANQNLNDTSLEFGKTTTTEITSENSVGLSVGISFGSSIETPLWGSAGSSEIKTTVTNSFTAAFSDSTENTYSKGFQSSPGDTKVVFTSIPYDVYEYLVIQSADTSKTPVGTYTTINVPRAPEMVSQSIDYYNENNGDGVDVDTSIEVSATRTVKPKAGEPASYPTYADCKAVAAAFSHSPVNALFSSKDASFDITVGQGSSSETLSIQSSATSSASYSYNLSVSTEMENVADGVLVGASFEMTSGYSYTTSVGKGVYVNLQLGQLDCDNTIYPDYKYTTGLMMFPVSKTYTVDDTAQTAEYTMVTCWVEQ